MTSNFRLEFEFLNEVKLMAFADLRTFIDGAARIGELKTSTARTGTSKSAA
jgi:hypothetical protein